MLLYSIEGLSEGKAELGKGILFMMVIHFESFTDNVL